MTTFTGDEYVGPELRIGKYRLRSNLTNSKLHVSVMDGERFIEAAQFNLIDFEEALNKFYKENF